MVWYGEEGNRLRRPGRRGRRKDKRKTIQQKNPGYENHERKVGSATDVHSQAGSCQSRHNRCQNPFQGYKNLPIETVTDLTPTVLVPFLRFVIKLWPVIKEIDSTRATIKALKDKTHPPKV